MSMRVNHNILAMNAHRNLWVTQNAMDSAVQRLSSGMRINYAWDDPAGLGVSERFRAQISGMVEAEKNANYNINLLATAEGALSVIDEKLIRMRAIAIQSANGALASTDREIANVEFQQLKSEITRIANVTNYNGLNLINGDFSSTSLQSSTCLALGYNNSSTAGDANSLKFHIGANNTIGDDYYYVNLGSMTAASLGLTTDIDVCNTANAQAAIDIIDTAIQSKDTERTFIGSMVERLQNTILNLQISQESATQSESTIRDADMAYEMMNFTRAQILMQTGISMMSQANMLPSTVAGVMG
ncbi:MAG: flagellin [candidate division Zixibacteria bacterium]|nr:flagellin [Candidatus Tariuqbacter arcticus]